MEINELLVRQITDAVIRELNQDRSAAPGGEDRIEKVILFKWNRNYPADTFFSLDLSGYTLEKTEDFAGNSHEKITKEIYRR